MEEYPIRRFRLVWGMAPRLPTSSVVAAIRAMTNWTAGMPAKGARMMLSRAKPATLDATERKAVTGVGAPWYTSGIHSCMGTAPILKAVPSRSRARAKNMPGAVCPERAAMTMAWLYSKVPVMPKYHARPKTRKPVLTAPRIRYLMPASVEPRFRRK